MWDNIAINLKPYLNALLIALGGVLLAFLASQAVNRLLNKRMGHGWSRFVANLVALAIGVWTVKLILDTTGAAGLFVVIVTAITGAFALGSERFAGDLVSGVSLLIARSYAVDDYVSLAGYEGKVIDISLMMTTLESVDGDRIFIRNSDANGGTIVNYSVQPGHLIAVKVPLPATQDVKVAVEAISEAIKDFSPELANTAYKPNVLLETSDYGYLILEVRAYVTERLDYAPEKTRLFLLAFDAMKSKGLTFALEA